MKLPRFLLRLGLLGALLVLLAACSFGGAGPATEAPPASTPVPTRVPAAVPTATPTPQPSPTPVPLVIPTAQPIEAGSAADVHALRSFAGSDQTVLSVDLSADGAWLAAGSADGTIRLWDAASGRQLALLEGHTDDVRSVAFSPSGDRLASVSEDGTIRLWSLPDGALMAEMSSLIERIYRVRYSPDGSQIALAGNRCFIELRESNHGVLRRTIFQPGCIDRIGWATSWGLAFLGQPAKLAMGVGRPCCGGTVYLIDLTGEEDPRWVPHSGAQINDLDGSPDGSLLAVAGNVAAVRLWSTQGRPAVQHVLEGHIYSTTSVRFAPDGSLLATGSRDMTVKLWDPADGALLQTLEGHTGPVTSVAFSADGSLLASGSEDGTAILWGLP